MRVLLVEDEAPQAEVARRGLEAEGWAVDVAADGLAGLDAAGTGDYDVVVCDLMMPGLSGYEVVRGLRARKVWTPVLVLTAKDGEYDEADAFDLGADDFLAKPYSFVVLAARIRALARRAPRPRPSVLTVGDLCVDPGRHEARRRGVAVPLTGKEFAVLEVLARRAGLVTSKDEILRAAWDEHFDGDANIVEVYVAHLRKKIDAPFGVRSIETVRGVGYRLVAAPDGPPA